MTIGVKFHTLLLALLLAAVASGCQTTLGQTSLLIRPGTSVAGRNVDRGDGGQIYMEPFEPRGAGMFIMVRFYPVRKDNKGKLTVSKFREWPKKLKDQLKKK